MTTHQQQLDPQVKAFLDAVQKKDLPELHQLVPSDARRQYRAGVRAIAGAAPQVGDVVDRTIPGPGGEIPVRLYRPLDAETPTPPLLVYFHGGGWSFGDLDTHDHVCRWLCAGAACLVMAVDYRLGPEHKFPAAIEDAAAAVRWAAAHAGDLGADPLRLAVGGDSAGGNLAAVAALEAQGQGGPDICFQLLIYPATDMTASFPSHAAFGAGYRLTRPLIAWSLLNYLREGRDMLDPRASPLFAEDFSGLPPAFILTAGFDPLRDEGKAYADKLAHAGVAVRYHCYDGMIHGFFAMPGLFDTARSALDDAASALSAAFK